MSRTNSNATVVYALIIAIPTMQVSRHSFTETRDSPKVRICSHSTVRRCDRPWRLPSFAAVAGAADVLAGSPIRGDLQAHLTVTRAAKQSPAATPIAAGRDESHNTGDAGLASLLLAVGEVVPDDDDGLGDGRQSVQVVRPGVSTEAREASAGGFPMDAGLGT